MKPPSSPQVTVRVDHATPFQSLQNDALLKSIGISLNIGEAKNINKNPVSERAISEVLEEIAKIQPGGGPVNSINLALAIAQLNSKLRSSNLSSLEMWTKRCMNTGKSLTFDDSTLIEHKQNEKLQHHKSSAKYKARGKSKSIHPSIQTGDIVFLLQDREKGKCRK